VVPHLGNNRFQTLSDVSLYLVFSLRSYFKEIKYCNHRTLSILETVDRLPRDWYKHYAIEDHPSLFLISYDLQLQDGRRMNWELNATLATLKIRL
jgi:hypothetical protein